jgi:hypothetical protein
MGPLGSNVGVIVAFACAAIAAPSISPPNCLAVDRSWLENACKPSREGVKRLGVEEEVGRAKKWYGDKQSINRVFEG